MKSYLSIALVCLTGVLHAAEPLPVSKDYWKSDSFLKEFNGSYRVNANIEPVLSGEVRAELVAMQKLMAAGKRKDVIKQLIASTHFKGSAALQFNYANVLSEEGELDKAILAYLEAIKLMPSFRRAHQNLAYAYVRKDAYDLAFPHLVKTVKLGGNDGSVLGLLGYCYQQKNQQQAALQAFRNAQLTQAEVKDWKIGVAHCLHQLGRSKEALVQYGELAKAEPKEKSYQMQMVSLLLDLGETQKAAVKLDVVRRVHGIDTDNELLLGTLHLSEGNIELGAITLKRVIKGKELKEYKSVFNAVRYTIDLSQDTLATELLALVPRDKVSKKQQVRGERMKAELGLRAGGPRTEHAVKVLRKLIKQNPMDGHSLYLLAQVSVNGKKYQEALLLFDQAIVTEGNYGHRALLEKSQVLVELKRYTEAIRSLKDYLEVTEDARVREYLVAVQGLSKASR